MTRRFFPTVIRNLSGYSTSDHRPMAETDFHRKLMNLVIDTLMAWYANRPDVYVTGNLLLFYEEGNRRRHISPDCFVVFGVPNYDRPHYLLWNEGKGPSVVIEITSKSTRAEDTKKKLGLYRDVLQVPEYFLFDPKEEYLRPSLQGYRLGGGEYRPIDPVAGRLPSDALGLHLERNGEELRLWSPDSRTWLPTPAERLSRVEQARQQAEQARRQAEQAWQQAERERDSAMDDAERLRQENEELRRRFGV